MSQGTVRYTMLSTPSTQNMAVRLWAQFQCWTLQTHWLSCCEICKSSRALWQTSWAWPELRMRFNSIVLNINPVFNPFIKLESFHIPYWLLLGLLFKMYKYLKAKIKYKIIQWSETLIKSYNVPVCRWFVTVYGAGSCYIPSCLTYCIFFKFSLISGFKLDNKKKSVPLPTIWITHLFTSKLIKLHY